MNQLGTKKPKIPVLSGNDFAVLTNPSVESVVAGMSDAEVKSKMLSLLSGWGRGDSNTLSESIKNYKSYMTSKSPVKGKKSPFESKSPKGVQTAKPEKKKPSLMKLKIMKAKATSSSKIGKKKSKVSKVPAKTFVKHKPSKFITKFPKVKGK